MIGCIDSQKDITVYLETDEIIKLQNETIEGVLIKIHKPKQQGKVFISVNNERRNENGFGVGVLDNYSINKPGGEIELFIGERWYKGFKEDGIIGLRYGMMGSKIHVYDRSRLEGIDSCTPEQLEFYRDNREKLDPRLG